MSARLALALHADAAHEAFAAGDAERDDDPLPHGYAGDGAAHLDHHTHRLVSEDVALLEERAEQLVEVQV